MRYRDLFLLMDLDDFKLRILVAKKKFGLKCETFIFSKNLHSKAKNIVALFLISDLNGIHQRLSSIAQEDILQVTCIFLDCTFIKCGVV